MTQLTVLFRSLRWFVPHLMASENESIISGDTLGVLVAVGVLVGRGVFVGVGPGVFVGQLGAQPPLIVMELDRMLYPFVASQIPWLANRMEYSGRDCSPV